MTFIISNPLRIGSGISASLPSDALRVRGVSSASATGSTTAVHDEIRDAANKIIAALGQYSAPLPTYSGPTVVRAALVGALNGRIAREGTIGGSASSLAATHAINTQTSTNRESSMALGLNLGTALSVLQSGGLGLDTTSPTAPSRLSSAGSLGLDVASAESASVLSSSAALGLDVTSPEKSSTITSMAPVITATTTYAPSVAFSGTSGTSTTVATLSGTYAGVNTAAAATGLTIKWMANATLGSTASTAHFQVLDQKGNKFLDYTGAIKAGDKVYLGDDIGLFVSFSAGAAVNGHTGTSAVSHSAPTLNLDAAFNAGLDAQPTFDDGAQVTAGSFSVNGTTITVNAGDTIDTVIQSINDSAAGVTASFDTNANTLTLTSNTASEDNIALSNDTSGFLAVMKLLPRNEEINTATTSYATPSLSFALSSTVATLSGTYTGVGKFAATTSLTVKLQSLTTLSAATAKTLSFVVADDGGKTLFSFNGSVKAGDKIAIGSESGLWISFSAGSTFVGSSASTNVSNTVGTDVNPDDAFNGDPNTAPRFENGAQVTAGSFTVNGTTVNVAADDTINTVLAKIDAVSGVSASFANDRITVTDADGSIPVLANDTSGFLAATKLAAAVTTTGNVRDDLQVLAKTSQFASVSTGSFSINGVAIAVDRNADSVSTIVDRINASAAGVTAAYDSAQDKIVLTTTGNSEDLITVSDDTSGFAAAANLASSNTVRGNIRDDQQVLSKTTQFGSVTDGSFTIDGATIAVDAAADSLNDIIDRINTSSAGVTASFDATANVVRLVGNQDSEDPIAVSNDSTGFLAAAQLDSANTIVGNLRDDEQVLAKTTQFGQVDSGSFTLNGVTIAVDVDNDSVESLVQKMNDAGAGVTASYDASADRIVLTRTTAEQDLVTVGDDTTGFLAATGLDTANGVAGKIADDTEVFSRTPAFGAVTDGSFSINGATIDVSASSDSLESVIGKINAADAGVTAAYEAANDVVTFTPNVAGATLAIDGDTSGLFDAVHVAQGDAGTHVNIDAAFNTTGLDATLFDPGLSVQAGSFTVNGVAIDVAADDTVRSVLARITASAAGVDASFDESAQSVRLTATTLAAAPITVADDSSGFLAAVKLDALDGVAASVDNVTGALSIAARKDAPGLRVTDTSGLLKLVGITPPIIRQHGASTSTSNAETVAQTVSDAVASLNDALSAQGVAGASVSSSLGSVVDLLRSAGAQGISFAGGAGSPRVTIDEGELATSLDAGGGTMAAEFAQSSAFVAVLGSLVDRFATIASSVAHAPSSSLTDAVKASFLTSAP